MQEEYGRHQSRAFVDSGPVAEKAWARQCGIGWQGKNTLVINKTGGSFCFIGIIYTELNLEADAPETDRCGDCQNCIKACPAGALHTPYRLDIEKCISYQTIENRQEIPPEVRPTLRNRIYGCDICQDVCPFNRHAKSHCVPEFNPSPALWKFRKKEWSELTEDLFASIFENSSIYRTGYAKFMSNIAAVREQSDPSPGYS